MKAKFIGHATVKIDNLMVDPWIKEIPQFGMKPPTELSDSDKNLEVLCITHSHLDHLFGVEELALEKKATIVCNFDMAMEFAQKGIAINPLNIGGTISQNGWKITMTFATHSATSNPSGFILQKEGITIYHAGDTGLFGDMKLIGEQYPIDYAFLPIEGVFTMNATQAVEAAKLLKAKNIIPIHYNTFDAIKANANAFKDALKKAGINCIILNPGQEIELKK